MRAIFTINLASDQGKFPDTNLLIEIFQAFGWEPIGVQQRSHDSEGKLALYDEFAQPILDTFPPDEASVQRGLILFVGYLAEEQTSFIVTRISEGQITFRFVQPSLSKLHRALEKVISKLVNSGGRNQFLRSSINRIEILESGSTDVVLFGRIITNVWREVLRRDKYGVPLLFVFLMLSVLILSFSKISALPDYLSQETLLGFGGGALIGVVFSVSNMLSSYREIRHQVVVWLLDDVAIDSNIGS